MYIMGRDKDMVDIEKIYEDTKKSHLKIKEKILKLDQDIDSMSINTPSLRMYPNHRRGVPLNPKRYAYCSCIFLNDSYMPSVLTLGMSMRLMKVRYPLVVLIQDKPYKSKDGKIYEGVSKKNIEDLMYVYDYVVGCDLLEIKGYQKPMDGHFTARDHYSNIRFYVTKLNVLGLTLFDKVFFLDSSTILNENIDWIFDKYQKSTFIDDGEYQFSEVGLRGAFCLVRPNMHYFKKCIYLIQNYQKIFGNLYFMRGVDEVIFYYSIYPHWSKNLLGEDLICSSNQIDFDKENCPIIYYQVFKPFKPILNMNPNIVKKLYKNYMIWDKIVKELLEKYPTLEVYYQSIRDFRENDIF